MLGTSAVNVPPTLLPIGRPPATGARDSKSGIIGFAFHEPGTSFKNKIFGPDAFARLHNAEFIWGAAADQGMKTMTKPGPLAAALCTQAGPYQQAVETKGNLLTKGWFGSFPLEVNLRLLCDCGRLY